MVDSCLGIVENRFLGVISCLGTVVDRFLGDGGEIRLVKLGGIMGCRVSLGRGGQAAPLPLSSAMGWGCRVRPGIRLSGSGKDWVEPNGLNLGI